MNASQLTTIKEAKKLLIDCSCFRGPEGPQGATGATGATGAQGPTGAPGTISTFTIEGASTNALMYYTGTGFGAMSSLFYYSSINVLEAHLSIIPSDDNEHNLGSSNKRWKDLYALNYNGIENYNYISTSGLTSTIRGLGTIGYISSSQLTSTVAGLGNIYISSFGSVFPSTVEGLGNLGYISSSQLTSTVVGLGTFGYISSQQLLSTVVGLGNIYISSSGLTSTVEGLGTVGYISSQQLLSTVASGSRALQSTVTGLGTFGYISSQQLLSTVASGSGALQSTTRGLGNIYLSSFASNPTTSMGNVLRVDSVYGDDTIAPTQLYSYPFKTINGAISNISATQTIHLLPGTYNETIVIPTGIAVRGENTQTVTIQSANSTSNTTLITMGRNSRLEDVTMNIYSSNAVDLIGINYPSGTSLTSKLRTTVLNVSSTNAGSNSTIGIYSGGTSALSYTTSHAIRGTTINVASKGNGLTRALYVTDSSRFGARDTNFSALGTSSIGVETTNVSSFVEIKQCSVNGGALDINRTAGTIQLSSTDLINATANGNSFSVNTEPSPIFFGVTGNIADGTKYLMPGTLLHNDLTGTFGLPFPQRLIVFQGLFTSRAALTGGQTAVYHLHKNSTTATPFMTATLNSANQIVRVQDKSESFNAVSDRLIVELTTSGNIGNNSDLFCALALY